MVWSKMAGRNMTTVDIAKFKDGKAVEHWIYVDAKACRWIRSKRTLEKSLINFLNRLLWAGFLGFIE
jgi:predicted SnoaL-like aldol condensation-catalyzing enzyme